MKLTNTDNLNYCNEAIELKQTIEGNFINLGEHLYNIKENNLFYPQWTTFLEFCDELRMSQNMINKLVQIYKMLVLTYGFTPAQIATAGGWGNLQEILPVISSKKQALMWLNKAGILTRQDLRKELTEAKTGIPMAKCKHKDTYTIKICRTCGQREQII